MESTPASITISGWILLTCSVPVLLLGEWLVRRIRYLSRFNIPVPVAGGLVISVLVLLVNLSGRAEIVFDSKVAARWWTWLVTPEIEWASGPSKSVNLPFLVGFFTAIGLGASWQLLRRGTVQMLVLLAVVSVLAVLQNVLGILIAHALHAPPLLGLICGSTTMTGGHGTALGMASMFSEAGLNNAATIGATAATFGLVAGGLVGGPLGGSIIRRRKLRVANDPGPRIESSDECDQGIVRECAAFFHFGREGVMHLLVLAFCIKAGAWLSYFLRKAGLDFPVYIGAMIIGVALRNGLDLSPRWRLDSKVIDVIASILLGIFLSIAMMSLNLHELANVALPMLAILSAQVIMMVLFARWITFYCMGGDYEAAVMAGGHCGFGLGATPNAVANMQSLVESFGAAPRAFLVLPIVGAFLNDFTNVLNITVFVNLIK